MLCGSCIVYNLKKNNLKFKLLAFWGKQTPFIDQKCTYKKVTKNWAGPSHPLIWTKSKRTAAFFVKPSLRQRTLSQAQKAQKYLSSTFGRLMIISQKKLQLTNSFKDLCYLQFGHFVFHVLAPRNDIVQKPNT